MVLRRSYAPSEGSPCSADGRPSRHLHRFALWGCLGLPLGARSPGELPQNVFRYILEASWLHQLLLLVLTVAIFLLEVVPLELQRRVVNNLVKHRDYQLVIILCAVYAGIIFVQGGAKLALNIYRGWVGERAKRDLRRRIRSVIEARPNMCPASKLRGSRSR